MKNLKNQKGITLVALVVTIIVLLILAGVSLSLVAGSNGIMTKAVKASDRNDSGTGAEQAELMLAQLQADYYEEYYVNRKPEVMGQTQTQYIEAQIGDSGVILANKRYTMKKESGKIVVEVAVSETDKRPVAERAYDSTKGTFTWTADYWTLKDVSAKATATP